ncbi:hypothetical protein D9619_002353 [Psilocybe cf. subviscida]|uniref:Uncharacterized protein n=1 Tax=Psilocybe cf. subviscida TaxID=2480587 RepID=A0A8H5ETY3_9AGAR|nr:hypothetical protein D9619_002353 [Psilocybe cf. subviscida]
MSPDYSSPTGQTAPANNHHELPSTSSPPSSGSQISQSSDGHMSTGATARVLGAISSLSGDLVTPSEIYRDHLQRKNFGHPLWIPGPNERASTAYRESGVMVGDVGIITSHGSFSYLFSVFHDAAHPRNAGMQLPLDFVPFATSPGACDIEEFREFDCATGCYLADDYVMRISGEADFSGRTILQTSAKQAAVLMLPETVYTADLRSIVPLRDYIRNNLQGWYKFVRDVKGWDIKNGDIRVVHSCRKSAGYGIATVSNSSPDPTTELTFSVQDSPCDNSRCRYSWSHRGCATVKAGPSSSLSSSQPSNQCLFVGTIDFQLGEDQWRGIEPGDQPIFSCHSKQNSEPRAQSRHQSGVKYQPLETSGPPKSSTSNHSGSQRPSGNSSQYCGTEDYPARPLKPLPSDLLTDVLMRAVPTATSVSVCTQDWGPYFTASVKDGSDFIKNVLCANDIFEEDGMVYFKLKQPSSRMSELLSKVEHEGQQHHILAR